MNPVACVQDFSFFLVGTRRFLIGIGSRHSCVISTVHGESLMSLPGTNSKVDNPVRSVPTAAYRVECPMIKAGYR